MNMDTNHAAYWSDPSYSSSDEEAPKLPSLEACVSDIRKWMAANVLLLNSDKTEILVLGPKEKKRSSVESDN